MDSELAVATQFVDLATLAYHSKKQTFSDEERACTVMLALVQSAGFEATKVERGLLRGNYLDQDGSRTGETYPVNSFPFKVVGDRGDDFRATTWLDIQFGRVDRNALGYSRDKLIADLGQAVLDSRPLTPVVLTDIGDALREYPRDNVTAKHGRDEDMMGTATGCVGVHDTCNGFMDRWAASKTHDALSCRKCNLRVGIPKSLKTYGDLRRHFAQFNS